MKKKIMSLLLLSLVISLVACGDKESNNQETTLSTQKETQANKISEEETGVEIIQSQEKTLADIEQFLKEKGVLSGEKTKMAAEMVGGIDGFKYSDCKVEIYEYDVNSEEYIKLSNGEEVPIKGMEGFSVKAASVNGKFVLMGEPSQEAIDIFNSFQ